MTTTTLSRPAASTGLLLTGFTLAVALRVLVGGADVARSATAGLLFAAVLGCLSLAAGTTVRVSRRALAVGAVGAAVLCIPAALTADGLSQAPGFLRWAAVVAVVAVAEEVFLRGTLYDAVSAVAGVNAAIALGAAAFALLHVPLYGWYVVPLDLAVGAVLGELRRSSGTAAAPALAHVGADFAAWFLR